MNHQLVYLELEKALKLKGYSPNTIESYVNHIRRFIEYYGKDLRLVSSEDVNEYIYYLLEEKKCLSSYVNTSISAIKFIVNNVLRMLIHIIDSKGKKDRYTLLSEKSVTVLRYYYRRYISKERLFEGEDKKHHLSEKSAQRVFEKACGKLGIKKNVNIHSLRHSFATHLLKSGTFKVL